MDKTEERLAALEAKVEEVATLTRRMYRVFFWTGVATLALFVLPLVLLAFAIPQLLSTIGSYQGLI